MAAILATVCLYPGGSGMFALLNSSVQFIESPQALKPANPFLGGSAGFAFPTLPQSDFAFLVSVLGDVELHGCPAPGTQHDLAL